jgi:hypothetical protein
MQCLTCARLTWFIHRECALDISQNTLQGALARDQRIKTCVRMPMEAQRVHIAARALMEYCSLCNAQSMKRRPHSSEIWTRLAAPTWPTRTQKPFTFPPVLKWMRYEFPRSVLGNGSHSVERLQYVGSIMATVHFRTERKFVNDMEPRGIPHTCVHGLSCGNNGS